MSRTAMIYRYVAIGALIVFLLVVPQLVGTGYILNAMIDAARWTIFALAFDLVSGQLGTVSLGQPVFFGAGAYLTALLGRRLGLDFVGNILFAGIATALLALVVGIAFFRIRHVTFAIGTMGFAIIAQMWVNTAMDITGGSLCTTGIPRPLLTIPFTGIVLAKISKPIEFYYLLLPLLAVFLLLFYAIIHSRVGRAFIAIREDETRASAIGIYPLRYKLLAFAISGAAIGVLGSYQASYLSVVCPSEMSQEITSTLMIMVFVGGVGRMRGVIMGAIIFSALPRLLESGGTQAIQPAYQQLVYGVLLMVMMLFIPNGLDSLLEKWIQKFRRKEVSS
jgi:ABC-type branched-subunit amino acid transport system permease subunit